MSAVVNPFISFSGTSGPPGDPHEFWRINITNNQGDANFTQLFEVELYEDYDHEDVTTGATTNQSSFFASGTLNAAKTIDRTSWDDGSLWVTASGSAEPSWVSYQLTSPKNISEVMLRQPTANRTRAPESFDVQFSDDGSAWTTKWSVSGEASWADREARFYRDPAYSPTYTGSPYGAHQYWAILCYQNESTAAIEMAEIEFRATPSGADQATGGTSGGLLVSGGTHSNAFDNDNGTNVASSVTTAMQVSYNFGSPVNVAEVAITAPSTNPTRAPSRFAIRYSDNGTTWSTAWDVLSSTSWTSNEQRVFTDPDYV